VPTQQHTPPNTNKHTGSKRAPEHLDALASAHHCQLRAAGVEADERHSLLAQPPHGAHRLQQLVLPPPLLLLAAAAAIRSRRRGRCQQRLWQHLLVAVALVLAASVRARRSTSPAAAGCGCGRLIPAAADDVNAQV
jgi:hypothetical protein